MVAANRSWRQAHRPSGHASYARQVLCITITITITIIITITITTITITITITITTITTTITITITTITTTHHYHHRMGYKRAPRMCSLPSWSEQPVHPAGAVSPLSRREVCT
jgi:hypothetical protein